MEIALSESQALLANTALQVDQLLNDYKFATPSIGGCSRCDEILSDREVRHQ